MKKSKTRDIEKVYTNSEFIKKLRRLADSLENKVEEIIRFPSTLMSVIIAQWNQRKETQQDSWFNA